MKTEYLTSWLNGAGGGACGVWGAMGTREHEDGGMGGYGAVGTRGYGGTRTRCRDMGIWGHRDMRTGDGGTRMQGYRDVGIWGYGDMGLWGHEDVGIWGHKDTWMRGYGNTRTWEHGNMGI